MLDRPLSKEEAILPIINRQLKTLKVDFKLPNYQTYLDVWNYWGSKSKLTHMTGNTLYRRFVGEDGSGGRIYGHWVQNCPSILRRNLTFNGLPTVEKDFASMQLVLLYGLANIIPPEGDLYQLEEKGLDRTWLKVILTKSVGAKSREEAIAALRKDMAQFANTLLNEAEDYFESFWTKHQPVYHLLFKGETWKKLQFLDSSIALEVLTALHRKNVTAIPIHDSFIVQKRYERILIKAMHEGFRKYYPDFVPIIK